MTSRSAASRALGLLPFAGLGVFLCTLAICFHLAEAHGRVRAGERPEISMLGLKMPEYAFFAGGFTLLALLMTVMFVARGRQLVADPAVAASPLLRRGAMASSALGAVAMLAMLVMAYIPADVSLAHIFAALATFGLLALSEVVHVAVSARQWHHQRSGASPGRTAPGPLALLWMLACPLASATFVVLWITRGSAQAQHLAVAFDFAYYLALAPTLSRAQASAASA